MEPAKYRLHPGHGTSSPRTSPRPSLDQDEPPHPGLFPPLYHTFHSLALADARVLVLFSRTDRYNRSYRSTIASRENSETARARPAAASRVRSSLSLKRSVIAADMAAASPDGTSRPHPSLRRSGVPPTAVATTGTPLASASRMLIEAPSESEPSTKTSRSR